MPRWPSVHLCNDRQPPGRTGTGLGVLDTCTRYDLNQARPFQNRRASCGTMRGRRTIEDKQAIATANTPHLLLTFFGHSVLERTAS